MRDELRTKRSNARCVNAFHCNSHHSAVTHMAAARHSPHTIDQDLLEAAATGNADLLEQILASQRAADHQQGATATSCLHGVTAEGSSALHIAASHGHRELVVLICTDEDVSLVRELIEARNNERDTPLVCAARSGHAGIVRYLIKCALDIHEAGAVEMHGAVVGTTTAMHEAVRNGHAPVLRELMMDRDTRRLAAVVDGSGASPLYSAVAYNRADMVAAILVGGPRRDGVSCSGPGGQTALHAAVFASGEICESLQQWDQTLAKEVDDYGRTALHYAAFAQKLALVKTFLANDSSLAYIPDNDGLFPVHIAAREGNTAVFHELAKVCLNYDELLDKKHRNVLHCAVEHGRAMLVWHICRNPKCMRMVNEGDGEGNTPLHLAVEHGRAIILTILMMDHRVNLNIINNEGLTPLDLAFSKINSDYTFSSFLNTSIITCLTLCEASGSPSYQARNLTNTKLEEKKQSSSWTSSWTNVYQTIYISAFGVATSSLAAAFTPPESCIIAEGKDASKLGLGAGCLVFMIGNTLCFFLCTTTIILFILAKLSRYRRFYHILSAVLVFAAVPVMLIAFATAVGLILYPASKWDEIILTWLASNVALPICIWIAMMLWTSKHRWQDIFAVVTLAILVIYAIRASVITVQSSPGKSVLRDSGRQKPILQLPGCAIQGDAVFTHPT